MSTAAGVARTARDGDAISERLYIKSDIVWEQNAVQAAAVWVENVGVFDLDLRFDSYAVSFEPSVSR